MLKSPVKWGVFSLSTLLATLCTAGPFDDVYPLYKYTFSPFYRMSDDATKGFFRPGEVALNFVIEASLGAHNRFYFDDTTGSFTHQEYQSLLKASPMFNLTNANYLRMLIRELQRNELSADSDRLRERNLEIIQVLAHYLGQLRVLNITMQIDKVPLDVLYAIGGLRPDGKEKPFLSLRRFGVMRRRGPYMNPNRNFGDPVTLVDMLTPLTRDRAHFVVGDLSVPLIPDSMPIPVVFSSEAHMAEFFNADDPSFTIAWSIGSEEVHDLSFRAYKAQFERGHRPNIDEKLLANLKIAASKLDLSRLFFAVVEDYVNEKALEVMTFIDGGAHDYDFYETPAEQRFSKLNLRERFMGELIEIHGLAVTPEDVGKDLSTDLMAIQLLQFIENGSHMDTDFILQADALPSRLYKRYGFELIEDSVGAADEGIVLMVASGKKLKRVLRERFTDIKVHLSPELPNRVNRRIPNPNRDNACLRKLSSRGEI